MLDYKNKKTFNFHFSNSNLEIFSVYGIIYIFLNIILLGVYFSFYSYYFEEIRYIFGFFMLINVSIIINMIYIYLFELNIKKIDIDVPRMAQVGNFYTINYKVDFKNKNSQSFIHFKLEDTNNIKKEKINENKLITSNENEKWGMSWSYGNQLAFNRYSLDKIDIEQTLLPKESAKFFARERGVSKITHCIIYRTDFLGFFRVKKNIKINNGIFEIITYPNIENMKNNENYKNKLKSINSFLTNSNIVGLRKAKHGDSKRDTHWKMLAKTNEHWVFKKEKVEDNPNVLYVDTFVKDFKNQSENFENMLSVATFMILEKMVGEVIINGVSFKLKNDEDEKNILKEIVNIDKYGELRREFHEKNVKKVLLLTINLDEEIKNILLNKSISFEVLKYE